MSKNIKGNKYSSSCDTVQLEQGVNDLREMFAHIGKLNAITKKQKIKHLTEDGWHTFISQHNVMIDYIWALEGKLAKTKQKLAKTRQKLANTGKELAATKQKLANNGETI